MLLLPGCEVLVMVRFGAICTRLSKSRTLATSSCSAVTARTDEGTSSIFSARLLAVTTTSSRVADAAGAVCARAELRPTARAQVATDKRRNALYTMIPPQKAAPFGLVFEVMLPVSEKMSSMPRPTDLADYRWVIGRKLGGKAESRQMKGRGAGHFSGQSPVS